MDATQKKELLHLRIEQANEQVLEALAEMAETLFRTWQPEVVENDELPLETPAEVEKLAAYEASLEPTSKTQFYTQVNESIAEYRRGESTTLEEVEK